MNYGTHYPVRGRGHSNLVTFIFQWFAQVAGKVRFPRDSEVSEVKISDKLLTRALRAPL